ncbi:MAG: hypothetical protein QJR08_03715 [Bacillota bacterium]|nr:hypothetical protein [Bacillota bacterium]
MVVVIPGSEDRRKKSWAKHLEAVDRSKTNGYAFVGSWLRRGERADLQVGAHVLLYDEPGSIKNWTPHVRLLRVAADGSLSNLLDYHGAVNERSWALAVRDRIAEVLAETQAEQAGTTDEIDLSAVPTEALIRELQRRGVQANAPA